MNSRLEKVQQSLDTDLLLIDKPIDLFYLTGLELSKGRLAIGKKEAFLFVDGRYFEAAQKRAPCPVILTESETMEQILKPFHHIAFDSSFVSVDESIALQKELNGKQWHHRSDPIRFFRIIKEEQEMKALRKAAHLTWEGYKHVESLLKEGVTETEMAWEFERYCRERGASEMSFPPIIAFGENSAYPHHRASEAKLKKDQVVLIDVGAVVDHYAGDLTRVVFFGTCDLRVQQMYNLVKKAQELAISSIKPGMEIGTLDRMVRDLFQKHQVESLFVHSLGHGIGLETHEYPRIKFQGIDSQCIIKAGMVFTIEPGLYQAGLAGIRYEDTVFVTQTGAKSFHHDEL